MRYLTNPGTRVTVLSAAGYVALVVLWHVSANRFVVSDATRELIKGACIAGAALLFLVVSVRLISTASTRGVLRGASQSATSIAVAAFCLAVIHGLRTDWGTQCNQCGGYLWLVIWPLGSGIVAFILSIMVGGTVSGALRATRCLTSRLSGRHEPPR